MDRDKEYEEQIYNLNWKQFEDAKRYGRSGSWNPKKGEYTSPSGAVFVFHKLKTNRYEP